MRTFSPAVADPLEGLLHQVVLAVPATVQVTHSLLVLAAQRWYESVWNIDDVMVECEDGYPSVWTGQCALQHRFCLSWSNLSPSPGHLSTRLNNDEMSPFYTTLKITFIILRETCCETFRETAPSLLWTFWIRVTNDEVCSSWNTWWRHSKLKIIFYQFCIRK